jgi:hypothetical protein
MTRLATLAGGMTGLALALFLTFGMPRPACGQAPPKGDRAVGADDVVEVEADGEGLSKEEATRVALRAALEKGGKNEIFSDTKVQNFQVLHDTIISRAQGIVKDYVVTREQKGVGGTVKVFIKAKVSKSVLARSWGELQNVLNQIGRPKILVWINERIDGKLEEQSLLETKIEEHLLKSGFDLVERTAVATIRQKELADAAASDNVARLQAIAKDFDAHIFIAGTANANKAGVENLYGAPVAFYNCDVQVKAYYTDTGKLLASKGIPQKRGGARGQKEYSPQAGKMAIDNVSAELVDQIYEQVMEQWATAIGAGGELVLEVEGMKFAQATKLKNLIAEIKGVEHVNFTMTKGIPIYRINAKMSAQDLAEKLTGGEFGKLLEVQDLKLNRIQAKAAAEK